MRHCIIKQGNGLERRKSEQNLSRTTGNRYSGGTTPTQETPYPESSWAHFDHAERGSNVQTSSASQLWRRKQCGGVSGNMSPANPDNHTTSRSTSGHKCRHSHGSMIHHHYEIGMSPTPPLRLAAAHKRSTSFPCKEAHHLH